MVAKALLGIYYGVLGGSRGVAKQFRKLLWVVARASVGRCLGVLGGR